MVLPALEAERLVQVIVLPRSRCYMRLDMNSDDVGVLVVGYGSDTAIDRLLAQPDMKVAVDDTDDAEEAIEAPDSNEWP